jgi:ribosomal protein S8E
MSSVMRRSMRRRRRRKKRKSPLRREDMATDTRQKAKVRQVRLVGDRVERVLAAAVIGGTAKNIISARHSAELG